MNRQEIFTKVKEHLLTQRMQALDKDSYGDTMCCYKSKDGRRCAIGCLIPDNLYDPSIEGLNIIDFCCDMSNSNNREIKARTIGVELGFKEFDLQFLATLQDCHDKHSPEVWERRLAAIAEEFKLNY